MLSSIFFKKTSVMIDFFFTKLEPSDETKPIQKENAISALINHPNTNKITFDPLIKRFLFDGKEYDGLMSSIKLKLVPKDVLHGLYYCQTNTKSGTNNGTRIHRQIHHIVTCTSRNSCDCDVKMGRQNKWVKLFFSVMARYGIEVVRTEVPVVSVKYGIITKIDGLGYKTTKNGKLTVKISVKTGFNFKTMDCGVHKLNPPFASARATHRLINQLQSFYENVLIQSAYGLQFDESIIVYLDMVNSPLDGYFIDTEQPKQTDGFIIQDELRYISNS